MEDTVIDKLRSALFSDERENSYAIVDGASCEELMERLDEFVPEHCCLYAGDLPPDVQEVAPYLVKLKPDDAFTDWLLANMSGHHWGILVRTPVDLRSMRKHFRGFLIVKDERGKSLYFRFYDPRVLRVFLGTCDDTQLQTVFGPVVSYYSEVEVPDQFTEFRLDEGRLRMSSIR